MYSVIIQNAKTYDAFLQFQPLFSEAFNSNQVGLCKWNEAGTTIDTALPELGSLTEDKEAWRAIIVRYADDDCMASMETIEENPYDFLINSAEKLEIRENDVPLIRLTQMLGGIPEPEMLFEPQIIEEKHKPQHTVYVPISVSEEVKVEYKKLQKAYRFDGKRPTTILLVTLRRDYLEKDNIIKQVWDSHKESESSEFWKRNQYPSICRFLVFDIISQGAIQREADDFNFWISVLILSLNVIDSGTLQAYRLYNLKTVFDKHSMEIEFQTYINRLRDAQALYEKKIREDIENKINLDKSLPDYWLDVAVNIHLPSGEQRKINPISFPFLSHGDVSDIAIWDKQKREIETALEESVRRAERTLDQTADRIRNNCTYSEEEVEFLDKYQEEDFQREMDELYQQIINLQAKLPTGKIADDEDMERVEDDVRRGLIGRVEWKPAVIAFAIAIGCLIASAVPAIMKILKGISGNLFVFIFLLLIGVAAIFCAAGIMLLIQNLKLNRLINRYNRLFQMAFDRLIDGAEYYSDYLSNIASHSRGASYIQLASKRKEYISFGREILYRNVKAINVMLELLKNWGKAFHLDLDFSSKRLDRRAMVDMDKEPTESKLFYLGSGELFPIGLNRSGLRVQSPFSFVKSIEIIREELYDDEYC